MAYANIEDVKARTTREFSSSEEEVICTLLEDAAVMIDNIAPSASEDAKCIVSCRMIIRAIGDGDGYSVPIGATQGSMTAGSYTQSWTMSGGVSGELYLGKSDKALLGVANRIGARSPVEGMVVHCD